MANMRALIHKTNDKTRDTCEQLTDDYPMTRHMAGSHDQQGIT